jgi:hypothetical protein
LLDLVDNKIVPQSALSSAGQHAHLTTTTTLSASLAAASPSNRLSNRFLRDSLVL